MFIAVAAMSLNLMAQKETLMTINGKPVSAEEFLYIYEKNNQAGAIDPKTMDEYLDMFINFKLKVTEAEVTVRRLRRSTCRTRQRWTASFA